MGKRSAPGDARADEANIIPTKDQTRDPVELQAKMEQWLRRHFADPDIRVTAIDMPHGSGVANETLLMSVDRTEAGGRRTAEFVARIEAAEPLSPGSDTELQFNMYRALEAVDDVPTPRVIGIEPDPSLLGAPFFLMEKIEGRVPPDNPPYTVSGWVTELADAERRKMWCGAIEAMARLHKVDSELFHFLPDAGRKDGLRANLDYFIQQIDEPYGERHRVIDHARDWLLANYPSDPIPGFSWGDSRMSNIIFGKDHEVAAILDWDMVSLAGPVADLAWWICLDVGATSGLGVSRLGGFGTGRQLVHYWEQLTGMEARHLDWHIIFGYYRCAVVVRRLTRMLREQGRMPPGIAYMEHNNGPVQYLTHMFALPPMGEERSEWPGLDV